MLSKTELEKLISFGEGYGVEFKEKVPHDLSRDLISFANANGGYVLLGVRDNGEVAGCVLDNRTKAQIEDIARHCDPQTSPGSLLKPITPRNIGGFSLRRNELISDVFSRLPYVERMGTGIEKIRRLCGEEKIPPPEISDNGFVTLSFSRAQMSATAQEAAQEKLVLLSDMQRRIVEACSKEWLSAREIAKKLKMPPGSGQFKDNIEFLVKDGFVVRLIPGAPRDRRQKYRAAAGREKART